jgi:hypothetical protein
MYYIKDKEKNFKVLNRILIVKIRKIKKNKIIIHITKVKARHKLNNRVIM